MKCLNNAIHSPHFTQIQIIRWFSQRKLISGNSYQILANGQFESSTLLRLPVVGGFLFSLLMLYYDRVCVKNRILSRKAMHANKQMWRERKRNRTIYKWIKGQFTC